jgi:hypothetical protein
LGKKKEKIGKKEKIADGWALIAYLENILFYSFPLRGLFCASDFSTRKHEFGELISEFSVRVFTGSVRDALRSECARFSGWNLA